MTHGSEMGKLEKLRQKLLARPVEMGFAGIRLLLEADGWTLDRVTGSHHHFIKADEEVVTPSPHSGKVRRDAITRVARAIGSQRD